MVGMKLMQFWPQLFRYKSSLKPEFIDKFDFVVFNEICEGKRGETTIKFLQFIFLKMSHLRRWSLDNEDM